MNSANNWHLWGAKRVGLAGVRLGGKRGGPLRRRMSAAPAPARRRASTHGFDVEGFVVKSGQVILPLNSCKTRLSP